MVLSHLAGSIGSELVSIFQAYPETRIGQHFGDKAKHFKHFFFRHR